MMEYKGYLGLTQLDIEADVIHGEVANVRDVITFQGKSPAELWQAFVDSVDDYLAFCHERGEKPDKPYSGKFVTRLGPELHRKISARALAEGKSVNAWVGEQLQNAVDIGSVAGAFRQPPAKESRLTTRRSAARPAHKARRVPAKAKKTSR
jgi:predicted HicB family RNase H-like nuclease